MPLKSLTDEVKQPWQGLLKPSNNLLLVKVVTVLLFSPQQQVKNWLLMLQNNYVRYWQLSSRGLKSKWIKCVLRPLHVLLFIVQSIVPPQWQWALEHLH